MCSIIYFLHPGKSYYIPLSIAQVLEYDGKPPQRLRTVSDREGKEAHLALVNSHITRLVEQSADLADQVNTLKARKQETAHLTELLLPILCALIALRNLQENLQTELKLIFYPSEDSY